MTYILIFLCEVVAYLSQQTITFSKSAVETLETGVKYVSKLTIKTLQRRPGVFIVNFETYFTPFFSVFIVDVEQVIACWVKT